jgi:hypothetical protein
MVNKMKFQKEWWKSGIKAWPNALLNLISFVFLIQASKIDYIELGYTQLVYTLAIVILTYLSVTFNEMFFEKVIKDMKSKGYFQNGK